MTSRSSRKKTPITSLVLSANKTNVLKYGSPTGVVIPTPDTYSNVRLPQDYRHRRQGSCNSNGGGGGVSSSSRTSRLPGGSTSSSMKSKQQASKNYSKLNNSGSSSEGGERKQNGMITTVTPLTLMKLKQMELVNDLSWDEVGAPSESKQSERKARSSTTIHRRRKERSDNCSMLSIPSLESSSRGSSHSSSTSNSSRGGPADVDEGTFVDTDLHLERIHGLGVQCLQNGEYNEALDIFHQILESHITQHGPNHPIVASTYHNIGIIHTKLSCHTKALTAFENAISIHKNTLGPSHPTIAVSMVKIGFLHLQHKSHLSALMAFRGAIEIRKQFYGTYHPLVAKVHNNLGVVYLSMGDKGKGKREFENALEVQRCSLAKLYENPSQSEMIEKARMEIANTLCNLGSSLVDYGEGLMGIEDGVEAEAAFAEALSIRISILGEAHPLVQATNDQFERARQNTPFTINSPKSPLTEQNLTHTQQIRTASRNQQQQSPSPPTKQIVVLTEQNLHKQNKRERRKPHPPKTTPAMISPPPKRGGCCRFKTTSPRPPKIGSYHSSSSSSSFPSSSASDNHRKDDDDDLLSLANEIDDCSQNNQATITTGEGDSLTNIGTIQSLKRKRNVVLVRTLENEDLYCSEAGSGGVGEQGYEEDIDLLLKDVDENKMLIYEAASACLKRNEYSQALALFHALLKSHREKYGELHTLVGTVWHNIGIVHLRAGRHSKALYSFQKAVRVRKGALGEDHPDVAVSLVKVGIVLLLQHQYDTSLLTFQQALTVRRHSLGHLHPSIARVYNNIGCVHVHNHEMRLARRSFESALDVQRGIMTEDPDNKHWMMEAAMTLVNLGLLYRYRKMWGRAILLFDEAMQMQEKVMGLYDGTVLSTMDVIADTSMRNGDCAEALRVYTILVSRLRRNRRYSRAVALILFKMSKVHSKQNDLEAAWERLEEAKDTLEKEVEHLGEGGNSNEKTNMLKERIERDIEELKMEERSRATPFEWV